MRKIFIIQIILYFILIIGIQFFLLFFISSSYRKERIQKDFNSELEILSIEINHKVEMSVEKIKALSSRTMIRKAFYSYARNEKTLNELKQYTQPKYSDGAAVYQHLIYALRTDLKGNHIAEYHYSNQNYELNTDKNTEIQFIRHKDSYQLFLSHKIIHQNLHIGYDLVLFDFSKMMDITLNYIGDYEIIQSTNMQSVQKFPQIKNSGWFLSAVPNQQKIKAEKRETFITSLIVAGIMMAAVILISSITILGFAVKLFKERDDLNHQLKKSLNEKNILFKEMNHRIKNNLNIISSYISLQTLHTENEYVRQQLKLLAGKISSVSHVHKQLQLQENAVNINIKNYFKELCDKVIELEQQKKISFSYDCAEDININSKKATFLGLILTEFILNSIKHNQHEYLNISLSITQTNHTLSIIYSDNGGELSKENEKTKKDINHSNSLGLKIVQNLMKQLDGRISFHSGDENRISLFIPI